MSCVETASIPVPAVAVASPPPPPQAARATAAAITIAGINNFFIDDLLWSGEIAASCRKTPATPDFFPPPRAALMRAPRRLDPDRAVDHLPRLYRAARAWTRDRKSTRLNSSHMSISYAVFCLKKKKKRRATR